MQSLPIDSIEEEFLQKISENQNIILKSSPGSGKTTRIPLFLKKITNKKIIILEPRRLAAKLAATQVARSLGEEVGVSVGYKFRFENKTSEKTQILFLTEGTFLRMLNDKDALAEVDFILLDEFHERHLSTDASLAFINKIRSDKKLSLKLIVMSATIDTEKLESYLKFSGKTYCIDLAAKRFDLSVEYLPNTTSIIQSPLERKVRNCVENILEKNIPGDILIFLPGMREIRDCEELLSLLIKTYQAQSFILHGDLDSSEQEAVLLPSSKRKIILSTNIAESSVTISGIRIVIDSGLSRESHFNFFSGLNEIKVQKISQSSAIQRAGRANREDHGYCFRLYAELDFNTRPKFSKPEIERQDLSELTLYTVGLFQKKLNDLSWFEHPPITSIEKSRELLSLLNACDDSSHLTAIGLSMLEFNFHPRISRILVEACEESSDSYKKLAVFLANFSGEKRIERFVFQCMPKIKKFNANLNTTLEKLILAGYPDHIAKSRGEKFHDIITMKGETLKINPNAIENFDARHPLWIVMDVDHKQNVTSLLPIEEDWLYDLNPLPITENSEYIFDENKSVVLKKEKITIGSITLSEHTVPAKFSNPAIEKVLEIECFKLIKDIKNTSRFLRLETMNSLLSKIDLEAITTQYFLENKVNGVGFNNDDKELFKINFLFFIKEQIDPEGQFDLELDFPLEIQLSDRRRLPIHYEQNQSPWIESFIQDFYGLSKTPILAKGKLPLTLKLLGPHKRALQVTQDLKSFWSNTYPQMLKELSREYPRHHWPVSPESAPPILLKRQLPS